APLRRRSHSAVGSALNQAAQDAARRQISRVKKQPARNRRAKTRTRSVPRRRVPASRARSVAAAPVTVAELRALREEIDRRMRARARGARRKPDSGGAPMRWNPEPEDVQRSVAQLVLTIV